MSLVLDGVVVETPGLETVSWVDDPKVPKATDGVRRIIPPTAVVLHTVHGKLGVLKPGLKPSTRAETYARYQANTSRTVSWHFTIDTDGTIVQSADPVTWVCYHATHANGWSVGIELVQDDDGAVYDGQMAATVAFLSFLCDRLSIPRRVPVDADGRPRRGVVRAWLPRSKGGRGDRFAGVVGHRNLTRDRGPGDPGDHISNALLAAGFVGAVV